MMKKLFFLAALAAVMAGCSESDSLDQATIPQQQNSDGAVKFDVYAQRGLTRGGGQRGDLNNANIGTNGFGVFAYYTAGTNYSTKAEPNFMFNQQVTCEGEATEGTIWSYEPVKYWPNEFGDAAISDDVDMISFFAYAPWTDFDSATGDIVTTEPVAEGDETVEHQQKYNIISIGKNGMNGDPIVKYVVDTDPATSVDLLWGVAAEKAMEAYTPIDGNAGSAKVNAGVAVKQGLPFIDMVKPNNPSQDRLMFNLKHALAKVKVTIDYIKDATTPTGEKVDPVATWMTDAAPDAEINPDETRIFVRKFTITGWANEGALNLNNTTPGEPLWKDIDGQKDLTFSDEGISFFDLRKDLGKEGTSGGEAKSEGPGGLNPTIVENYAETEVKDGKTVFGAKKNPGVPAFGSEVPLFAASDASKNNGFFYIIPRNDNEPVNVTIMYDVETIDDALKGKLSDDKTHGSTIENIITKRDIFNGIDFKAGYQYEIKIHLGMTSVKIEATVQPWVDNEATDVDLPDNQDPTVDLEDADNDNKPFIEAGTTFSATVTKVAGVAATGALTLKTTGNFLGGFAEVTIEEGTIEGVTLASSYYVPASQLKEGCEVELLTITPPSASTDPVDPGTTPEPSRMTRGEEEQASTPTVLYRTGIFVLIGGSSSSQPTEPEPDSYYSLSVSAGDGGSIDPYEIAAENKDENDNIKAGTSVTVTASANSGHNFTSWTVNGETVTENPYTFTIEEDMVLVANFDAIMYTVSATSANTTMGTASVTPSGTVAAGTEVRFTATANSGYKFMGWTGDYDGTDSPYTVSALSSNLSLTANFAQLVTTGSYSIKFNGSSTAQNVNIQNSSDTNYLRFTLSGSTYRFAKADAVVGGTVTAQRRSGGSYSGSYTVEFVKKN